MAMSAQELVEKGIENFLKEYRQNHHLEKGRVDQFIWNERDCQWRLCYHLRKAFQKTFGRKGTFWVHAEGPFELPKKRKWKIVGRADITIMDPDRNSKLYEEKGPDWEPYDVVLEMKLVWRGTGPNYNSHKIKRDLEKLKNMLDPRYKNAKSGYFILLDGLDGKEYPILPKT